MEASSEGKTDTGCFMVKESVVEVTTREGIEETPGGLGCVSSNEGEAEKS
jgi:hypothetical protein